MIDLVLAVGAASKGNLLLLLFGLLLSVPMVVFMSSMLPNLLNKHPITPWLGAGVPGKVGGEMVIPDPWVHGLLTPPKWVEHASMLFFVAFVCVPAKVIANRRKAAAT